MKKIILLTLLALIFSQTVKAQDYSKIEKPLLEEMSAVKKGERIRINIILNRQYDRYELRSKSTAFSTKEAKRAFVVNELKRFSEEAQRGFLETLASPAKSGEIAEVRPLWIANAINCFATAEAIEEISRHPDILTIGYDRTEKALFDGETATPAKNSKELAYNITQVNADAVWELGYTGEGIIVAVIDTGVNYNHNDLAGNMWEHPDYPHHGYDFYNRDDDPMDDHSHGTHCAGTVAGQGASGTQTGMAPSAKIMAIKIMSAEGGGSAGVMCEGIEFAVDNGAHVLSMSFGMAGGGTTSERILFRNTMINTLEAGIVASVGAGNEREYLNNQLPVPYNVRLPGNCPPPWLHPDQVLQGGTTAVVCVGATDINDELAYFSSEGPVTWQSISGFNDYALDPEMGLIRPDVCAPGVDIKSLLFNNNTGYTYMSGTSMATPGVAGVMALMLSKNPNLSPAEINEILEATAKPLSESKNNMFGSGRIDALAAMEMLPMGEVRLDGFTVDDVQGNNNGKINPGETIEVYVDLKNLSTEDISGATATIASASPWITIENETIFAETLAAGTTTSCEEAFKFTVSEDAPPRKSVYFTIEISAGKNISTSYFSVVVFDYSLKDNTIEVEGDDNENEALDPGESGEMIIYVKNIGNESALGVKGVLESSESSGLTIHTGEVEFGDFTHDQIVSGTFNVSLTPDLNIEEVIIPLQLTLTDEDGRVTVLNFEYRHPCTKIPVLTLEMPSEKVILLSWESAGEGYLYNVYRNNELLLPDYYFSYIEDDTFDPTIDNCYYVTAICPLGIESPVSNTECYFAPDGILELDCRIDVYPNPANSALYVEGDDVKEITVYNLSGQKLYQTSVRDRKTTINTASFESGIYLLEITTHQGEKTGRRFLVAR